MTERLRRGRNLCISWAIGQPEEQTRATPLGGGKRGGGPGQFHAVVASLPFRFQRAQMHSPFEAASASVCRPFLRLIRENPPSFEFPRFPRRSMNWAASGSHWILDCELEEKVHREWV